MSRDDLAWRRMSPREKLKAIAAEQNASGRDRLQEVLVEQRQQPGAPNAVKWHQALAEQKGGAKLHVRPDDVPTPERITAALNIMNLYGPEVDEACGVEEPAVDMWEAGLLVPTREQIHRLAMLTGFPWRFFYQPAPPPITGGFICGDDGCRPLTGEAETPAGQGELF
jgi:hypothetical protein